MPRNPDRTIGERIRLRRKARGWSIRFAASRAGIAHSTWSRIEAGTHGADNRFLLADLARALECSIADLTGQPLPPTDRTAAEAQAGVHAIRRALIECDRDEEPTVAPRPAGQLSAEIDAVTDMWRRSDFAAAAARLPDLLRTAHAVAAGPDREAGLRLLVRAAYRASSTARFVGTSAESWLAAERCRQAATELADPVCLAWAELARAASATSCGSYGRSAKLASRAVDALCPHLAAPGALEMLGMLQLTAALAAMGERRRDEAAGWLAEADAVGRRTGDTGTVGLWFGPTNIGIWRVSIEADGGDPGRAVDLAATISPQVLDAPVRHATYYADLARALARVRRGEQAVRMLLTAERIAPQQIRASPMAAETTRILLEQAPRGVRTGLAGLSERLGVIGR